MYQDKESILARVIILFYLARKNLEERGSITHGVMAMDRAGKIHFVPCRFDSERERIEGAAKLKSSLNRVHPSWLIVVGEGWSDSGGEPIDLPSRSPFSTRDLSEAIVITAKSGQTNLAMVQLFNRTDSGFEFEEPIELANSPITPLLEEFWHEIHYFSLHS